MGEKETRTLEPVSVQLVAGDGVMTGSDRVNGGMTSLRWGGSGQAPYLLFDFGTKVAGLLRIKSRLIDGTDVGLRCFYGAAEDFTPFEFRSAFGEWQSEDLCAFRFLKVGVSSDYPCPTEVEISHVSLVKTEYPFLQKGSFECDDERLNEIWRAGVQTVRLCAQPNYLSGYSHDYCPDSRSRVQNWRCIHSVVPYTIWDGVRRDRESWLGDALFGAFTFLYAGGDPAPVLSTLEVMAEGQMPDGELHVSAYSRQRITDQQMAFAMMLEFYIRFAGDLDKAARYLPAFRAVQEWIMARLDDRNLVKVSLDEPGLRTWQWTINRDGVVTYVQAFLYNNLLCAAAIEEAVGEHERSRFYVEKAELVKRAINDYLWNEAGGYYETMIENSVNLGAISHDGNVLCLLYGIAEGNRAARLERYLKEKFWTPFGSTTYDKEIPRDQPGTFRACNWAHNRQVWSYFNTLEVEARLKAGLGEGALELTKRCFGNMVERGPGTIWEMALASDGSSPRVPFCLDQYNSQCHAWGGYISYLLQAYVAGIRSLQNGFEEVLIAPCLCGLTRVSAAVPTPRGIVSVCARVDGDKGRVETSVPEGVRYEFDGAGMKCADIELIVNGDRC